MSRGGFRSLLAALDTGFQPAGVAMGAVAFQIMRPFACSDGSASSPVVYGAYEDGLREAWRTAIERLEADAARLGCHGVVGVSVKQDWSGGIRSRTGELKLQLTGSAVRAVGVAPLARPFVSLLSWQDTLKLLLGGWAPSGIAVGCSAVHVHARSLYPWRQGARFTNAEMEEATAGVQLARARAEHHARRPVVGRGERSVAATVTLEQYSDQCRTAAAGRGEGRLIEGQILATAITRYRDPLTRPDGVRDLTGAGARG